MWQAGAVALITVAVPRRARDTRLGRCCARTGVDDFVSVLVASALAYAFVTLFAAASARSRLASSST